MINQWNNTCCLIYQETKVPAKAQSTMATASDLSHVKQMETLLECSICNETLTQPRTLSCFHSYCKHCLDNFVATRRRKAVRAKEPDIFECPLCQTEFHIKQGESVEKILSNHFINNMLELRTLQQQAQLVKCQSCKAKDPAASRCVTQTFQPSRFTRDCPGLDYVVPVSRFSSYCPGFCSSLIVVFFK